MAVKRRHVQNSFDAISVGAGAVAAPSISIGSSSAGWYYSTPDSAWIAVNNGNKSFFQNTTYCGIQDNITFALNAGTQLGWSSSNPLGAAVDTILVRDAANVLAMRNSTNPQGVRFYKTYTDASNYERLSFGGGLGAAFAIQPEAAGTGTVRALTLVASGGSIGFFGGTGATQQTSGANLTNNVTVGGSNDVIADFTNLTTYATDAATIRNDIYQLARKLKQVNDALRAYGLLT